MYKTTMVLVAALACLLGIQTYRAHRLAGRLDRIDAAGQTRPALTGPQGAPLWNDAPGQDYRYRFPGTDAQDVEADGEDLDAYLEAIEARDQNQGRHGEAEPGDEAGAPSGGGKHGASQAATRNGRDEAARSKKKGSTKAQLAAQQQSHRLVRQAKDAMARGDYDNAIALLQEGLEADPENREAYRDLAGLYQKLGMNDEAAVVYDDWIAERPQDAVPYYQQARLLERLGMDEEALAYLDTFLDLTQGELSAYPMAASMYRRLNMREEEGALLDAWAGAAPSSVEAHRALAQFYTRNGNKPGALAEYQRIVALTPGNATAHRNVASAYQRLQMYDQAQAELAVAMNLEPQDMAIRIQLAGAYRQGGELQAALEVYYGVIADEPESAEARRAGRRARKIERQLQKPKG